MTTQPRVAVVGGSLVGPAAEHLLRTAGLTNVTTYEASRIARPQSGGAMGLRPATLDVLGGAGIAADALVALRSRAVVAYDVVGTEIRPRRTDPFPGVTTSWDALHGALADRVDVQLGRRVTDVADGGLVLADGTEVDADLVVFADGRRSRGRELLDPSRRLAYQGYVVWRGLTAAPRDVRPTGFTRYYDDPHGTLFSITEPLVTGETYWEFSHNLPAGTLELITGRPAADRAFLLGRVFTPAVRDLVTAFATVHLPPVLRDVVAGTRNLMGIPVLDLVPPARAAFRVGATRAVLVSDALAPVRLQSGMGLNGGVQQVGDLAARLRAASASPADLDAALRAWETATLERLLPWIELGRVRAARTNLGTYHPARPGWTVPAFASRGSVWDAPTWTPITTTAKETDR